MRRRSFILAGLIAVYAVCFAVIKAGLAFAPPLFFGGLRALLGGAFLLGLTIAWHRPLLPPRPGWPWIIALALTATTVAFGAMFLSPGFTSTGTASVLGNTQPLIVVVLAALYLGEPMTRAKWATLALGLAGVILISSQAMAAPGAGEATGVALALAASAGAAAGSVLFKRMAGQTDLLPTTAWQLIIGSLPLLAASAVVERGRSVVWSAEFVAMLLFLALVGTSFAYAAWYWLIQRDEVGRVSMFLFLVPLFGLAIGALTLGERITVVSGLGSLFTISGIAVAIRPERPDQPDSQAA